MMEFKDDLDREAIVEEEIRLHHPGRVHFQRSWWSARCTQDITIAPGETVYVVGRHGITLLVEPIPSEHKTQPYKTQLELNNTK
jgi:membrane protein implicated in regulation of membrane protease activity